MSTAMQQHVFALDARYNAHRTPNCPNFSMYLTFYNKKNNVIIGQKNVQEPYTFAVEASS